MRTLIPQTNKYLYIHDNNQNDLDIIKETWLINVYRIDANRRYDTVVDVGANFGGFTTNIASLAKRIISVEPESENKELLKQNIIEHNIENKVTICDKAIGGHKRSGVIPSNAGGSSIYDVEGATQKIDIITLADLLELYSIDRADILKIDVEGAEKEILLETPSDVLAKFDYITAEFDNRVEGDILESIRHLNITHAIEMIGAPDRGGMIYARRQ